MSVFRIATKQAIREIIEENATNGRFGLLLTEEGMEGATDRIVDLFQMTLELRSTMSQRLGGMVLGGSESGSKSAEPAPAAPTGGARSSPRTGSTLPRARTPNGAPAPRPFRSAPAAPEEPTPFPKSKNAAEIYDLDGPGGRGRDWDEGSNLPLAMDLKLPRKRIGLTASERDKLPRS